MSVLNYEVTIMKNNNENKYALVIALTVVICLVFMIPYRADANGHMGFQKDYFKVKSVSQSANNTVDNYNLSVIEDEPVPLSAGDKDYSERALSIVAVCFVVALAGLYITWFRGHKRRITSLVELVANDEPGYETMTEVSIFHPVKTIRFESELENRVVSDSTKSV